MVTTVGMGDYVYEYQPEWPRLPVGQGFQGHQRSLPSTAMTECTCFNGRGLPCWYSIRDGNPVAAWERTDGVPADAHHIHVGPDDSVYLVDRDAHQILKYSPEGELLSSIGTRNRAALQAPFKPSSRCLRGPLRELFVADGYGNSSVHQACCRRYPDRLLRQSRAEGPASSWCPTASACPSTAGSTVADRENNRVQVFTVDGDFVDQWTDFKCPMGVHIDAEQRGLRYRPGAAHQHFDFGMVNSWPGAGPSNTPHQVYTDSQGNIYGADTSNQRVQKLVRVR